MTNNDPRYSRVNRKKMRNRSNQLLNIMIGLVVVLILVVGTSIIIGNNDDGIESVSEQEVVDEAGSSDNESLNEGDESGTSDGENGTVDTGEVSESSDQSSEEDEDTGESDSSDEESSENEGTGTVTVTTLPGDGEVVKETVIDPSWKPIGTVQTGAHESIYDENHVDWDEKKKALSYATGHPVEGLIFWRIGNAGGPQKSYGIVSTRDKSEMYRVYLEWVDEKGWQPVKMDILNTLDFEY